MPLPLLEFLTWNGMGHAGNSASVASPGTVHCYRISVDDDDHDDDDDGGGDEGGGHAAVPESTPRCTDGRGRRTVR